MADKSGESLAARRGGSQLSNEGEFKKGPRKALEGKKGRRRP